jgi:hypothetical protein
MCCSQQDYTLPLPEELYPFPVFPMVTETMWVSSVVPGLINQPQGFQEVIDLWIVEYDVE